MDSVDVVCEHCITNPLVYTYGLCFCLSYTEHYTAHIRLVFLLYKALLYILAWAECCRAAKVEGTHVP